jgi:hypothetical protein
MHEPQGLQPLRFVWTDNPTIYEPVLIAPSVVAKSLSVSVLIRTEAVRIVGLPVIVAVAAKLAIVLAVSQTLLEVIHVSAAIAILIRWSIAEALLVALAVGTEVAPAIGLLVIVASAAVLAIVLPVPQSLLEVTDVSASIVFFIIGRRVPEALSVTVLIGLKVVRVVGLLVIIAVAAKLPVVLAVTQSLLKRAFIAVLMVVAVVILALLWGKCGGNAARPESSEGNSKCQHPY